MVIPKKRRVGVQIIMPLFAAALLATSASNGLVAGAVPVHDILKFIDSSSRELAKDRSRESSTTKKNSTVQSNENKRQAQQTKAVVQPGSAQGTSAAESTVTKFGSQNTVVASTESNSANATVLPAAPPDTSTESRVLSDAQSKKSVQPVLYQSAKISMDRRDELLKISALIAGVAGMLYAVSYASLLWRLIYGEPEPVRRSISQQN